MSLSTRQLGLMAAIATALSLTGCVHLGSCRTCGSPGGGYGACGPCGDGACGTSPGCGRAYRPPLWDRRGCQSCDPGCGQGCGNGCGPGCGCRALGATYGCISNKLTNFDLALCSAFYQRSNSIPETLPLGSTNRAWYQAMETNAEAADFIIHRLDFVGDTARLTPDGRDHIWEIAARMPSTPFPVIVERSENNSNPELDALRRQVVVAVLSSFGNADAEQRTVVSQSYGPGYTDMQAEPMYYRHVGQGGGGNNPGTFGNNLGQFGGFGGGGGGGIGFGN